MIPIQTLLALGVLIGFVAGVLVNATLHVTVERLDNRHKAENERLKTENRRIKAMLGRHTHLDA